MISFRYHLVSIVAVFVALAVGILVGTAVLDPGLLSQLRKQTASLSKTADAQRSMIAQLQGQLAGSRTYEAELAPWVIQGQLAGQQVVVVSTSVTDPATQNAVVNALDSALTLPGSGTPATVAGVILVKPTMALVDPATRARLAAILHVSASTSVGTLRTAAAEAIAARLAAGPPTAGTPDILKEMADQQLISMLEIGKGGVASIGGAGQAVVVVDGPGSVPLLGGQQFLVPLVRALVRGGSPVVAAETQSNPDPFVGPIRTDTILDGRLVTVDDADTTAGQIAVVLGLRVLLDDPQGGGGDYGIKAGAQRLVPAAPAP